MKNKSILLSAILFLTTCSTKAMQWRSQKSGELSLTRSARAIGDGIQSMLSDPATLTSSACLVGWHVATTKAKTGFFDANTYKEPQVIYSLVGGVVGKTIRSTINVDSYEKLPSPIRVVLSNPFLTTYIGLHCYYRFKEFKNNPLPIVAETGLLAVHLLSRPWWNS